jgi:hypothetical protein
MKCGADILEGRHPAPPEFAPLYAVLSAIAAQHTAALRIRSAAPAAQPACLPAVAGYNPAESPHSMGGNGAPYYSEPHNDETPD